MFDSGQSKAAACWRWIAESPCRSALFWGFCALLLGAFHLDHRGLWTDELKTLEAVRLPARELSAERMANGHFPTYFLALKAWRDAFGESERALRSFSLLLAAASVALFCLAARGALGTDAAFWAALFYVLNERRLWASQEARPYALAFLAAAGMAWTLLGAWRRDRRRLPWWAGYAAFGALGLVSHASFVFFFAAQAAAAGLWLARRRAMRWDWIAALSLCALFGAAAFWILGQAQTNRSFFGQPRWMPWDVWREGLLQIFWGEYDQIVGSAFKYIGLPLIALIAVLAWRARGEARHSPAFELAAAWALSALVGIALVSAASADVIKGFRYYAIGAGGAALLQGLAVASLRREPRTSAWLARCLAGGIVAIHAVVCAGWLWSSGEQAREAIRYTAENRLETEPVLFCDGSSAALLAEYYNLGAVPVPISREEQSREPILALAERAVGGAPGFWLILYKEKESLAPGWITRWAREQGYMETRREFDEARAIAYRRPPG